MVLALLISIAILLFALSFLVLHPEAGQRIKRLCTIRPKTKETANRLVDFFVASRIRLPIALGIAILYYGQLWVLRSVAHEEAPASFFNASILTDGLLILICFLIAYCIPYISILTYLKRSGLTGTAKHEFKHFGFHITVTCTSIALVAFYFGKPIGEFVEEVANHVPIVIATLCTLIFFIIIGVLVNKMRSTLNDKPKEALINSIAASCVITFLTSAYWIYSNKIIVNKSAHISGHSASLLSTFLFNDSYRLWLLAVPGAVPFVYFIGRNTCAKPAYRYAFSGLTAILVMALFAVILGDNIYLAKIQTWQTASNIYYSTFKGESQEEYVRYWITAREIILGVMILWSASWACIELYPQSKRTITPESLNDLSAEDVKEYLVDVKKAIEEICSRKNWLMELEVKQRKSPKGAPYVLEFVGLPWRIRCCIRRLSKDQNSSLASRNCKLMLTGCKEKLSSTEFQDLLQTQ